MSIKFDFSLAHPDYPSLLQPRFVDLLERYPQAALKRVYVGEPRRKHDLSMGFYDEDSSEIWLNGYWFSKPPAVLQKAARTPPFFHGAMIEEPLHLCIHEVFHAIEYGMGFRELNKRAEKVWRDATKIPRLAPADYALSNPVEFFAELGACVEMGLATEEQQAQLRWIFG
jgi:hypothetical protein